MIEALFGFVGVIVGSGITWAKEAHSSWENNRRSGRYLAIRASCLLDTFADDCIYIVYDDGLEMGQRARDGTLNPQVKLPNLISYPEDIDWKSINHALMHRLLSFLNDIEFSNRCIRDSGHHADPPDYEAFFEERQYNYALLGIAALDLSRDLLKGYDIEPRGKIADGARKCFDEKVVDVENRRRERATNGPTELG